MARPRKFATGLFVLLGSLIGVVVFRRRWARRRERVDLYFGDGSMLSIGDSSAGAERLLPLARNVLASARS
jgi:hypothetical protein